MGTIGRGIVLTVDDGGGAVEVANITSADLNLSVDLADDTTNDHDGWKANCRADAQAVLDVTCKYAETGALLDLLDEAYTAGGSLACVFTPISGGDTYTFTANISSLNISASTGETIDMSFTLESTGTVTKSA
jgi:hypothetical protein